MLEILIIKGILAIPYKKKGYGCIAPLCRPIDMSAIIKKAKIYGIFLVPDLKHPLAKIIHDRWTELHYLSGNDILITVPGVSVEWTESLKKYWQDELGEKFDDIWEEWQVKRDSGEAYSYMDIVTPPLEHSQLPCLLLYTDFDEKKAIIRSLPDWNEDDLYELLKNIFGSMRKCIEKCSNQDEIYNCLQKSISSNNAQIFDHLDHIKKKAFKYIKNNPTEIISTTASFIVALTTGNPAFALSPLAVVLLKELKEIKMLNKS